MSSRSHPRHLKDHGEDCSAQWLAKHTPYIDDFEEGCPAQRHHDRGKGGRLYHSGSDLEKFIFHIGELAKLGASIAKKKDQQRIRQERRQQRQMPVCRHFMIGSCTFGSACRFSHDSINGKHDYNSHPSKVVQEFYTAYQNQRNNSGSYHNSDSYLNNYHGYNNNVDNYDGHNKEDISKSNNVDESDYKNDSHNYNGKTSKSRHDHNCGVAQQLRLAKRNKQLNARLGKPRVTDSHNSNESHDSYDNDSYDDNDRNGDDSYDNHDYGKINDDNYTSSNDKRQYRYTAHDSYDNDSYEKDKYDNVDDYNDSHCDHDEHSTQRLRCTWRHHDRYDDDNVNNYDDNVNDYDERSAHDYSTYSHYDQNEQNTRRPRRAQRAHDRYEDDNVNGYDNNVDNYNCEDYDYDYDDNHYTLQAASSASLSTLVSSNNKQLNENIGSNNHDVDNYEYDVDNREHDDDYDHDDSVHHNHATHNGYDDYDYDSWECHWSKQLWPPIQAQRAARHLEKDVAQQNNDQHTHEQHDIRRRDDHNYELYKNVHNYDDKYDEYDREHFNHGYNHADYRKHVQPDDHRHEQYKLHEYVRNNKGHKHQKCDDFEHEQHDDARQHQRYDKRVQLGTPSNDATSSSTTTHTSSTTTMHTNSDHAVPRPHDDHAYEQYNNVQKKQYDDDHEYEQRDDHAYDKQNERPKGTSSTTATTTSQRYEQYDDDDDDIKSSTTMTTTRTTSQKYEQYNDDVPHAYEQRDDHKCKQYDEQQNERPYEQYEDLRKYKQYDEMYEQYDNNHKHEQYDDHAYEQRDDQKYKQYDDEQNASTSSTTAPQVRTVRRTARAVNGQYEQYDDEQNASTNSTTKSTSSTTHKYKQYDDNQMHEQYNDNQKYEQYDDNQKYDQYHEQHYENHKYKHGDNQKYEQYDDNHKQEQHDNYKYKQNVLDDVINEYAIRCAINSPTSTGEPCDDDDHKYVQHQHNDGQQRDHDKYKHKYEQHKHKDVHYNSEQCHDKTHKQCDDHTNDQCDDNQRYNAIAATQQSQNDASYYLPVTPASQPRIRPVPSTSLSQPPCDISMHYDNHLGYFPVYLLQTNSQVLQKCSNIHSLLQVCSDTIAHNAAASVTHEEQQWYNKQPDSPDCPQILHGHQTTSRATTNNVTAIKQDQHLNDWGTQWHSHANTHQSNDSRQYNSSLINYHPTKRDSSPVPPPFWEAGHHTQYNDQEHNGILCTPQRKLHQTTYHTPSKSSRREASPVPPPRWPKLYE